MKFISTLILCLAFVTPALAEETQDVRTEESLVILFDTDKAELSEAGIEALESVAAKADSDNLVRIIVLGHADGRGDRLYNLDLGDRRAQSVKAKLLELGVKEFQIYAASYGEEKPIAPNDSVEEHLASNRRAEVIPLLVPKPDPVEPRKNRITVYGGGGPMDLHQHEDATGVDVHQSYNAVGGVGYARMLSDRWSLGIAGFSNLTFTLSLGYDF